MSTFGMALTKQIANTSFIGGPRIVWYGVARRNQFPTRFVDVRKKVVRITAAVVGEDLMNSVAASATIVVPEAVNDIGVMLKVRVVVTLRQNKKEGLMERIAKRMDAVADLMGQNVVLQLVSTKINPRTKGPNRSNEVALKDWSKNMKTKAERIHYIAEFTVGADFGIPGAVMVVNNHRNEFFLETMTVEGFTCGPVHFPCNSWVQPWKDHPEKRIFFSNKPYLPSETPAALKAMREEELRIQRGNGKGLRKFSERIHDYDMYNDLGNPDRGINSVRPTLGGPEIPYPRRCRTGRAPTDTDLNAESRVEKPLPVYVPRDEQFEEIKWDAVSFGRLKAALHNLLPSIKATISNNRNINSFSDIDCLYKERPLLRLQLLDELLHKLPFPNLAQELIEGLLVYDIPEIVSKDKFAWLRDDEFARQAIAGVNPVSIQRLTVFPPQSKLDPVVYGDVTSALKEEHIIAHLHGLTVQQAIDENKLFILNHNDVFLPFLERINNLDGRKCYATRTIYFLTPHGTLKPIAIELSLPSKGTNSPSKRVVTPPVDATTNWTWQIAKAHVNANDSIIHQLVNHWLRTHACLEPFILAAHRQLSVMHPIYKLLDPHMRYTLQINVLARQSLINADGIIESSFTPGRYCMEISAAAYKNWRFDEEDLHSDLIRRGMAVPDVTQPHGLRLVLEDYPYAADGLLVWSAIENWVRTYVNYYYPSSNVVSNDHELQGWYTESINVGHADIRHAEWWPKMETAEDLIKILTKLIWLASAQHAALNFGQYPYGGYVPNRPPLLRRLIPNEGDPYHENFIEDPQKYYLSTLPSLLQSTKYMAVVDTLSTHSPDEEYLGERQQPSTWTADGEMIEAFFKFSAEIRQIEDEIERRNRDTSLRNRCGAGVLPYELLAAKSKPGMTFRGIPNSVSI